MENSALPRSMSTLLITLFYCSALIIAFSISSYAANDNNSTHIILLNCGSSEIVLSPDGVRKFVGDHASKFAPPPSTEATASASASDEALYMTARLFAEKSTYKVPISDTAQRHFLRLHFHPSSYNGLNSTDAVFSVNCGPYALLHNFTPQALNQSSIVMEFCIHAIKQKQLDIIFTPEENNPKSYAFINAMEIISISNQLFEKPARLSNSDYLIPFTITLNTDMQSMYRLNVGGQFISPATDKYGRTWYDDSPYIFGAATGTTGQNITEIQQQEDIFAPERVYATYRSMHPESTINTKFNLTWIFSNIDSNFSYLVRLHFCELQFTKDNQRSFNIDINNQTVEQAFDVFSEASGSKRPICRDYVVNVPADESGTTDMWVALYPNKETKAEYYNAILNGLEIFKLNFSEAMAAGSGFSDLSPMALLKALLDLGHDISVCEKPKACQRRNASAITRRIKVLCLLFEEIRDNRAVIALPPSALLCLREMHVMFQRTRCVLEEGNSWSSVWLVMQTEAVAAQFHQLTQDMATALDVLPLKLMDVTDEVREQVELLHKQSRRAGLFVDPAEQLLRNDVLAVLDEFENKVTPDAAKLRKIFDSLEIKDASGCRREIDLLEDEIRKQSSCGTEATVSMINSLIGFMRYCKCVLFGVTEECCDKEEQQQPAGFSEASSTENIHMPDDFKCPISLDLMHDPVIVATGQTYDRVSITRWIEEGHSTCPKSGQKLLHTNLIPNNALRSLICQWCEKNGVPFDKPEKRARNCALECIATTKAALEATKMTAAFLVEKLSTGAPEVKKQVAYELRVLAKCGMDKRACIAEAGAIPLLLPLLSSDDPKSQENAVTALLNLSIYENNKVEIVEAGCLDAIIRVLKEGRSMEARENAAATLFSLSVIDEYKRIIGEKADAIPALVELLRKGSARGKRDAATALFNLSIYRGNDVKTVDAGAVPLLVTLLTDERPSLTDDALAVLAVLASRVEGLLEIQKTCAIPVLVSLLRCAASSRAKENAIAVLVALCRNGGNDIVNEVVSIPSLVPSMYTLLTAGTPRAKRKARSLFKILQRRDSPAAILHSIISSTTANTITPLR